MEEYIQNLEEREKVKQQGLEMERMKEKERRKVATKEVARFSERVSSMFNVVHACDCCASKSSSMGSLFQCSRLPFGEVLIACVACNYYYGWEYGCMTWIVGYQYVYYIIGTD